MSPISREGLLVELLLDGNAEDTSGRGNHGVVDGATPTTDRSGNPAGAYQFDGTDDYIVVDAPPLDGTSLSVSVWARFDTVDTEGWSNCLVCQDDGNDDDQSRRIFQLSAYRGRIVWHRMTRTCDPASTHVVAPGVWIHVAAVFQGGVHRLYLDGELHDTVEDRLLVNGEQPIHIGRKGTPEPCFFFHGALDDLRVFARALHADEVRLLCPERASLPRTGGSRPPRASRRADPISGTWETDDGHRLELSFDGERRVTGAVPAGHPGRLAAIRTGTFDRHTRVLILEGEARHPAHGGLVQYTIQGTLDGRRLTLGYRFGDERGGATLRRVTRLHAMRRRFEAARRRTVLRIEPFLVPGARAIRNLQRPSRRTNVRLLRERGESTHSLVFRDATPEDIPALAALHVKTWSATYPGVRHPPTFRIREGQWREAFAHVDGSWFCIVIENMNGQLVGFAKGIERANRTGDLNKIYLLGEYQRMGVGRRLVGFVVRRFLDRGVSTMTLSADAANPSCRFYLALGAENPRNAEGRLERGSFVWRDLERLASICPVEAQHRSS